MQWRIDNTRPVYLQVEEHIRHGVIANIYPPGERIPSVRELATKLKVNPNTIQRAMTELENQGLLIANGTLGKIITTDRDVINSIQRLSVQSAIKECAARFKALGLTMQEASQLLLEEED